VLDGVREQDYRMENRARALQPQHKPEKPLLPGDILEESKCVKGLADPEEEKMENSLGGLGDEGNHRWEGVKKTRSTIIYV